MVEASRAHRRFVAQPALRLVGYGERRHEFAPAYTRIFGRRQRRSKVVAWMAGLSFSQVTVIEIQIAHESAIVERRLIWGRSTAADQSGKLIAAEILDLRPNQFDRLSS